MDTFKKRLKFYMIREGLNPASLSRKAQLNITAVRDILEHEGNPNTGINTFLKLCRALGVTGYQLSPEGAKLYPLHVRRLLDKAIDGQMSKKTVKKSIGKKKRSLTS